MKNSENSLSLSIQIINQITKNIYFTENVYTKSAQAKGFDHLPISYPIIKNQRFAELCFSAYK